MDALQSLTTRRSIRKFTRQTVDDNVLELLLRAAMAAPSAFNEQPWHFVVARNAETLLKLSTVSPYAGPMAKATLGIIVCGETARLRYPDSNYWIFDCVAAMENLLVAANGLGLGAVWLGIQPWPERIDAVRAISGVPDGVEPLGMAAIGWPDETKPPADRYDESRVHIEQW